MMKQGIRILAVDDSRFSRGDVGVLVAGIVGRGELVEGVLSFRVEADGDDSTMKLIRSVRKSRFMDQIRLIAINGTTVAGMNIVDILRVSGSLMVPVLAITRKKPHPAMLKRRLRLAKPKGYVAKIEALDRISGSSEVYRSHGMYVQAVGIGREEAAPHLGACIALLRLARMVAGGIATGESRGRM